MASWHCHHAPLPTAPRRAATSFAPLQAACSHSRTKAVVPQPRSAQVTWATKWQSPMEWAELDRQQAPGGGGAGDDVPVMEEQQAKEEEEPQEEVLDMQLRVRISLAEGSGKLDLTDCRLTHLPAQVLELTKLEDLSLAGNCLTSLPEGIGALSCLKRLGLAGNRLTHLPDSLGALTRLEGLWLHGNLVSSLPQSMSALISLKQLSLSGNQLTQLPDVWEGMEQLDDMAAAGNQLTQLPASLGQLRSLRKLSLNGNRLTSLPSNLSGLSALQELWLQGNSLTHLPEALAELKGLKELSLADNQITHLPSHLSKLASLQKLWIYGNNLATFPAALLSSLPNLAQCWLEGNPQLRGAAVTDMLQDLMKAVQAAEPAKPASNTTPMANATVAPSQSKPAYESYGYNPNKQSEEAAAWKLLHPRTLAENQGSKSAGGSQAAGGWKLKALGLDTQQLQGVDGALLAGLQSRVKVGEVLGSGAGYFKLSPGPLIPVTAPVQEHLSKQPVLVVAFGSAPGSPNWGGLLGRVYRAAQSDAEKAFDVLYVVDPSRQWYGACAEGDAPTSSYYHQRLEQYTRQYDHVIMLGDSMGATAALMFAPLATHVLAFCPQVDLSTSCMRPGVADAALTQVKQTVLEAMQQLPSRAPGTDSTGSSSSSTSSSSGSSSSRPHVKVVALSGTWQHDLDQVNALPDDKVRHQVYSLDSHRLALYLEGQGKLLPLVQEAVLSPLGLATKMVRTANLL